MKFSEMPYSRPDIEAIRGEYDEIIKEFNSAKTADGQIDAIQKHKAFAAFFTLPQSFQSVMRKYL